MAAIPHASVTFTADDTIPASTPDTVASIPSSNFVAGRRYILWWRAFAESTASNDLVTSYWAWASSGEISKTRQTQEAGVTTHGWLTPGALLVTAPDPVEDLNFDASFTGSGAPIFADGKAVVIDVEDAITAGFCFIAEDDDIASPVNVGASGAFVDFAALTQSFTEGTWGIFGHCATNVNNTGSSIRVRLGFTGGGLSAGQTTYSELEGEDNGGIRASVTPPIAFALDGTEATFVIQAGVSSSDGAHHKHRYSSLIGLYLDQFEQFFATYDASEFEPSSADTFEEAAAITPFTPDTAGDWIVFGGGIQAGSSAGQTRLQVGGVSLDSSNEGYLNTWDARDNTCFFNLGMDSFSGSTDIDFDFKTSATAAGIVDRTAIAFSMELAGGGGTGVSADLQALFNIAGLVRLDNQKLWSIAELVSAGSQCSWNISELVAANNQVVWDAFAFVNSDGQLIWNVAELVGAGNQTLWNMMELVSEDGQLAWSIAGNVGASGQLLWNTASLVSADSQYLWDVSQYVAGNLQLLYRIRENVNADAQALWDIAGLAASDAQLLFNIQELVAASSQLLWEILEAGLVGKDLQALYNIAEHVLADAQTPWDVLELVQSGAVLPWNIAELLRADSNLPWRILETIASDAQLLYSILEASQVAADLLAQWNIAELTAADLGARWAILGDVTARLLKIDGGNKLIHILQANTLIRVEQKNTLIRIDKDTVIH